MTLAADLGLPTPALKTPSTSAEPRPSPLAWAREHAVLRTADERVLRYADVARDYQDAILADAAKRIIVAKSRQIGISQAVAFIVAAEMLAGGKAIVVSRDQKTAGEFLAYVRTALDGDPDCPDFTTDNAYELALPNGGTATAQPATRKAGRGSPATLVVLDELAWQDYADVIYTAVLPTLSTTDGRLIIMSSVNGRGNLFHRLWEAALRPGSGWSHYELPYTVHPEWGADPDWPRRKMEEDQLTPEAFAQEYAVDFAGSGVNTFADDEIRDLFRLAAFAGPVAGHSYVTAWDIARKRDAFVGITIDISTAPFQVAHFVYRRGLDYPPQADIIAATDRLFNGIIPLGDQAGRRALSCKNRTVVESNGVGDPLIQFLSVKVEEFNTTALTKKNALDALKLLLQRRELVAPEIAELRRELTIHRLPDVDIPQDTVMAGAIAALHAGRPVRGGGWYTNYMDDR